MTVNDECAAARRDIELLEVRRGPEQRIDDANRAGDCSVGPAFVEGENFERTAFTHPFVGRLTPAETASFLVEHFDHHMRQIDRLLAQLKAKE